MISGPSIALLIIPALVLVSAIPAFFIGLAQAIKKQAKGSKLGFLQQFVASFAKATAFISIVLTVPYVAVVIFLFVL